MNSSSALLTFATFISLIKLALSGSMSLLDFLVFSPRSGERGVRERLGGCLAIDQGQPNIALKVLSRYYQVNILPMAVPCQNQESLKIIKKVLKYMYLSIYTYIKYNKNMAPLT